MSMENSDSRKPHTDCWSQEHQLQRAALVFLREKMEGTLFVEFEALVSAKEGGDFEPDVKVKVMDDDVRWCVG
ncbi:unnamed protein product [Sphagnum jensenii]